MLSDAHIDAANRAVTQVFETTSLAWRTIPHWFTGDPGRTAIRSDAWYGFAPPPAAGPGPGVGQPLGAGPYGGPADQIQPPTSQTLAVTLAAATASTADQVVSAASAKAVEVVQQFDRAVAQDLAFPALRYSAATPYPAGTYNVEVPAAVFTPALPAPGGVPLAPAAELLAARSTLETAGYFGSRCVWAGADYFVPFHGVNGTRLILPSCASLLQMSAIYRWVPDVAEPDILVNSVQNAGPPDQRINTTMLIIGRRQEIAPGRAFDAAPGPEPIDLAVSVPPSIEIIGDDKAGNIQLAVRIRYALRFKDNRAVVVWTNR